MVKKRLRLMSLGMEAESGVPPGRLKFAKTEGFMGLATIGVNEGERLRREVNSGD
jgi:hypothetical protein